MNTTIINKAIKNEIQKRLSRGDLYQEIQMILARMDEEMVALLDGAEAALKANLKRIISAGGKRLRPILAYLCYRMGDVKEIDILPLMCMLELMHTASLIHDDVVDNALLRRGQPTINNTCGISAAVQSGDFLLAKTMEYLHVYRGTGINEVLVDVSTQMCLGELMQQKARFDTHIQTKDMYFLQVYRKTASLIAASCYTGALASNMAEPEAKMLRVYGEKLGIAFQLRDDLLDYSDTQLFGKTTGQDIKSGTFTLPVIMLLEDGVPDSVRTLLKKRNKSESEVHWLVNYVKGTGVLRHAEALIKEISREAVYALQNFPLCSEKEALVRLAEELAERQV
jgi:heptaprenyl diphosphate synthase